MFSSRFSRFSSQAFRQGARGGRRRFTSQRELPRWGANRMLYHGALAAGGAFTAYQMGGASFFQNSAMCAPAPSKDAALDAPGVVKNTAFVFIKPHAVTDKTKTLVAEGLKAKGLNIVTEGDITGKQIDEGMLVDQHYYAIASKATLLKPHQLNVPPAKFEAKFGLSWSDALAQGKVFNAKDACEKLGLDSAGLNKHWANAKNAGKLIKFGGGFYCGLVEVPGQEPIYVFNGFFMSMRNKYVAASASIHYYVVEWDSAKLGWEDFRGKVLGPTDPADAPADSLRGIIMADWEKLGLKAQPNVGDNGVHASASPFEALAERMNWLGAKLEDDDFGKLLLKAGITEAQIKEWSVDPQVSYGASFLPITMSLFDSLEDTDSDHCLARQILIAQGPTKVQ